MPLEVSPGREATCRAVFGTWGSFPDDARAGHCPFVLTSFTGWSSERCPAPIRGMRGFPLNTLEDNEALVLLKIIIAKAAYVDKVVDRDESTSGSSSVGDMTWISSLL